MATPTMNVSLTPELKAFIERRVRSGLYGNGSDVVRAGLRALVREEIAEHFRRFQQLLSALPPDLITAEIEEDIERRVKASRSAERRKKAR